MPYRLAHPSAAGVCRVRLSDGDHVVFAYRRPAPGDALLVRADLDVLALRVRRNSIGAMHYLAGQSSEPPVMQIDARRARRLADYAHRHIITIEGVEDAAAAAVHELEPDDFAALMFELGLPILVQLVRAINAADGLGDVGVRFGKYMAFLADGGSCNCPKCEGVEPEWDDCNFAPFEPLDELAMLWRQWDVHVKGGQSLHDAPGWIVEIAEHVAEAEAIKRRKQADEKRAREIAAKYGGGA